MSFLNRAALVAAILAVAGCHGGGHHDDDIINTRPDFLKGAIVSNTYDGNTDDLLTAGVGKSGLGVATPPAVAVPTAPTTAELRRLAIFNNYRALVDANNAN